MTDDTGGRRTRAPTTASASGAGAGLREADGSSASDEVVREASCRYFENRACEYYPCHAIQRVNCLFCFCPLYHLPDCGGEWKLTDKGAKDCSACARPHGDDGYDFVMSRLS